MGINLQSTFKSKGDNVKLDMYNYYVRYYLTHNKIHQMIETFKDLFALA